MIRFLSYLWWKAFPPRQPSEETIYLHTLCYLGYAPDWLPIPESMRPAEPPTFANFKPDLEREKCKSCRNEKCQLVKDRLEGDKYKDRQDELRAKVIKMFRL